MATFVPLDPIAADDSFGGRFKHRSCRLLLDAAGLRKLCWMVLERDGSVSVGISDETFVIKEIGTSLADSTGRIQDSEIVDVSRMAPHARAAPHVTLHRSGICHIRAGKYPPLIEVDYSDWCPPSVPFEWLYIFTVPARLLPAKATAGKRDAIVPFDDADQSVVIRVDILPSDSGGTYPLLDGFQAVIGIAPEYAVRFSVRSWPPIREARILLRDGRTPAEGQVSSGI